MARRGIGVGGAAIGWRLAPGAWRLADPIIGLLITAGILLVLKDAAREVFRRLMDAVDPDPTHTGEEDPHAVLAHHHAA